MKIGSYNIKHAADGGCAAIGEAIVKAGLDICGLQELDYMNTRSNEDQAKLIAEAAGMPYYRFTKAIDFRGGQYGTAIMSKYPIESFTLSPLYSAEKEARSIGHAVIDVRGVKLDFYCTHLSFESRELRDVQFKEIADMISKSERFVLVGDFNTENFSEFDVLGDVSKVNSYEHRYVTFPGRSVAIDNIIASKNINCRFDSVYTDSHSDHYMLTAVADI